LDGRFAALRVFHQFDDLRERGFFPTLVASNFSKPSLFNVAPMTGSPGFFSTGAIHPSA